MGGRNHDPRTEGSQQQEMERERGVETPYSWAVMVASLLGHYLIYGISWTVGVYFVIFLDAFQQGKGPTSWVGSMLTASMYMAAPVSSVLMKKTGMRWMMVIGAIIGSAGLLVSAFATKLWHLYISYGIIAGFGLGLAYIPCITAVGFYFDKHRTIAIGISASGVGIGTFIYPPLIQALEEAFGWRGSLLVLSGVTLNLAVIGFFIRPKEAEKETDQNENEVKREKIGILQTLDIYVFKNTRYLLLCLNNVLAMFGVSIVYVHLSEYAEVQGIKGNMSVMLFSALGIANFLGRIFFGFAGHHPKVNVILAYIFAFLIAGIPIECLPVITTYPGMVAVAVVFGFFTGSIGTYLPDILIMFLCLHRLPCGYGYLLIFEGIGQLIGAPVAGILFDYTGTYVYSFYLGGACLLLSGLVLLPTTWRCMKPTHFSEEAELGRDASLLDDQLIGSATAVNEHGEEQKVPDIAFHDSVNSINSIPRSKSQRSLHKSQYSLHSIGVINREILAQRRTSSAQCICQYPIEGEAMGSNRYLSAVPARLAMYRPSSARSLRPGSPTVRMRETHLNIPSSGRSQHGSKSSVFSGSLRTLL